VNYVAKSIPTVPFTHRDSPRLKVLAQVLSQKYLHTEIREKGGAYGGGARSNIGNFTFYSYRDPRIDETLNVFNGSTSWLKAATLKEKDLEEAKLSIFQDIDAPIPPSRRGTNEFNSKVTFPIRQAYRDALFSVTKREIKEVAERYLVNKDKESSVAVLGSEQNTHVKEDKSWEYRADGKTSAPTEPVAPKGSDEKDN